MNSLTVFDFFLKPQSARVGLYMLKKAYSSVLITTYKKMWTQSIKLVALVCFKL